MAQRQQTITSNRGAETVSTAGLDGANMAKIHSKITRKMQEGFISGYFYPETAAEKSFLREHRATQVNQCEK